MHVPIVCTNSQPAVSWKIIHYIIIFYIMHFYKIVVPIPVTVYPYIPITKLFYDINLYTNGIINQTVQAAIYTMFYFIWAVFLTTEIKNNIT